MDSQTAQTLLELALENSKLNKEFNELKEQIALIKPKKKSDAPVKEKKSKHSPEELAIIRKENGLRLAKSNQLKKEHFERLKAKEASSASESD